LVQVVGVGFAAPGLRARANGCLGGGRPHGVETIAQEEKSVTLPVEAAFDVAAEMLVFLMDEKDVVNPDGIKA
jgi:hypothetical protein